MADTSKATSPRLQMDKGRPWLDADFLPVCLVLMLWGLSAAGIALFVALLVQDAGAKLDDGICLSRLGIWLAPPVLFWGIIGGEPRPWLHCGCASAYGDASFSAARVQPMIYVEHAQFSTSPLPGLLEQVATPSTATSSGAATLSKAHMSSTSSWRR